jgi:hypothetical protein
VKIASYPALAADSGKLIAMNCSADCTLTLPSVIQAPNYTLWVSAIGDGKVTLSPNGRQLDGATASIVIPHSLGLMVTTDGTNYFTSASTLANLLRESSGHLTIRNNVHMGGPDPLGVDATLYGVREIFVPGGLPVMTCSITAGSYTATCPSTTGFRVGDGINFLNAGATNTMATPSQPTVTPTVSTAGTFTGLVRAGPIGGTTYNYCIMGWDVGGGHTACSPVGSTTVGQASLGRQTATINTIALANDVVTVNTTTSHGYPSPCSAPCGEVYISGTQNEHQFFGRYEVGSAADATHFTFQSHLDTRDGASPATYNGGSVVWFNQNHIVAHGTVAGNNLYAVYGRAGASLNFIGVMLPQLGNLNQISDVTYLTFDDYGSTMTTPPNIQPYIPSAAAVTATNDNLITKITKIEGTTVTLSDQAINSVSSGSVLFDNTAPFNDAVTASKASSGSTVYFPTTTGSNYSYVFRSVVNLQNNTRYVQSGYVSFYDMVHVAASVQWDGSPNTIPCHGGSTPSFGAMCLPQIAMNGPIGFHVTGGVFNLNNVNVVGGNPNQNVILLIDQNGQADTFHNIQFNTGWSPNDYGSRIIVARGNSDGSFGEFSDAMDNVLFNDFNPGSNYETDETPSLYASYSFANTRITRLAMQKRGILIRFPSPGSNYTINGLYTQGNENSLVTYFDDINATIGNYILMEHIVFDTTPVAGIVNLKGNQSGQIYARIENSGGPGSTGVGNMGFGSWINGPNIFSSGLGYRNGVSGIYTGWSSDGIFAAAGNSFNGYPQQKIAVSTAISPLYPLFTQERNPPAPSCVVTTSGPPYTQANAGFNLVYAAIYPNGGQGALSLSGTACASTDGATQQATVTIPALIPGAIALKWWGAGGGVTCSNPTSLTSCIIGMGTGVSSPNQPASGPTGMHGQRAWTNQLTVGQYEDIAGTTGLGNPSSGYYRTGVDTNTGQWFCRNATGANCNPPGAIANTTTQTGTAQIGANSCTSPATQVSMPGVTAASTFWFTSTTDVSGVAGWGGTGGLRIVPWPTTDTLNYKVCNQTASPITPGGTVVWNVSAR